MRYFYICLVSVITLTVAGDALADARSQARRFFQQGFVQLEEGKIAEAIESFIAANDILPHPDVQYNIARACADGKRYADAIKWYKEYLDQDPLPPDTKEIQQIIQTLSAQIPRANQAPEESQSVVSSSLVTPQYLKADVEKLKKTAEDIRALNPQRAEELAEIAKKYAQFGRQPAPAAALPQNEVLVERQPSPQKESSARSSGPTVSGDARLVEDYEEQEIVTAATGEAATTEEVPAVVWVLTQQDIRHRGYESVAEVLQNVAGLHVIDNFVFVDIGVRGVHEGLRGQTRLVKVLIDGQPTSFRLSSGNFLGLEMIPIRAVDRIELIRGPASALYGANAFSGVLQIVTRRGGDVRGGSIATRVGTNLQAAADGVYSAGGDLVLGTKSGRVSMFFAGSYSHLDRSGLLLPESSPLYENPVASRNDISSPSSAFGRVSIEFDQDTALSLDGGYQNLKSRAEWLDYAPLSDFNQVALRNLWARLSFNTQFEKTLNFSALVAYTKGATAEGNQYRPLRTGATTVSQANHIEENLNSEAFNTKAELLWAVTPTVRLRFGGDFEIDLETISIAEIIFDEDVGVYRTGDRAPAGVSQHSDDQIFANSGFYTQVEANPTDWISAIGGFRFDYNNRYGASINGRLGSVFSLLQGTTLKILYGSSFRAPSPDQIFHNAAYIGDTIGCENFTPCRDARLQPQYAHTGEAVVSYNFDELLQIQMTGYISYIDDLILSFPTQGGLFVTTNAGTYLSTGIETEISTQLPQSVTGPIVTNLSAYASFQNTEADIPESQFSPPETIRPEFREQSLYPDFSGGFAMDLAVPSIKLGMYSELRYIGERRASGSNLVLGAYENGTIPGFIELDTNLSTRDLYLIAQKETVISLRMTNLTGSTGTEGGFRGWDIPRMGRTVFLRVIQEF